MLVSQLRQKLEPARTPGQGAALLQTRAPGYLLVLERCALDLLLFEELVADGRRALDHGDAGTAADAAPGARPVARGPRSRTWRWMR